MLSTSRWIEALSLLLPSSGIFPRDLSRSEMSVGLTWTKLQAKPSILDPHRDFAPAPTFCAELGPLGPGQGLTRRPWPSPYFFSSPKQRQRGVRRRLATPFPARSCRFFSSGGGVGSQIGVSGFARNADLGSDPSPIQHCVCFCLMGGG